MTENEKRELRLNKRMRAAGIEAMPSNIDYPRRF